MVITVVSGNTKEFITTLVYGEIILKEYILEKLLRLYELKNVWYFNKVKYQEE